MPGTRSPGLGSVLEQIRDQVLSGKTEAGSEAGLFIPVYLVLVQRTGFLDSCVSSFLVRTVVHVA